MFNFIYHYIFIPVSGCVCGGTSALLCPGSYNAVKTALGVPESEKYTYTSYIHGRCMLLIYQGLRS